MDRDDQFPWDEEEELEFETDDQQDIQYIDSWEYIDLISDDV